LRNTAKVPVGYREGWNVRYTTELTEPVFFYVRGEEYSAQLDHFVRCISNRERINVNSFASAAQTDHVLSMMAADAQAGMSAVAAVPTPKAKKRLFLFGG